MTYYSQAWQDNCVAHIFNFKKNGYYLDIGSFDAKQQSNSYFFESELGWHGICVEQDPSHVKGYESRNCHFINADATQLDYKAILDGQNAPKIIDYGSFDIDENTTAALHKIPFDDYKFALMTVEHDSYRVGDAFRNKQRELLRSKNYTLLFSDVLVPLGCGIGPDHPFEDWYVSSDMFDMDKLTKLARPRMYPDNIADLLHSKNDTYLK